MHVFHGDVHPCSQLDCRCFSPGDKSAAEVYKIFSAAQSWFDSLLSLFSHHAGCLSSSFNSICLQRAGYHLQARPNHVITGSLECGRRVGEPTNIPLDFDISSDSPLVISCLYTGSVMVLIFRSPEVWCPMSWPNGPQSFTASSPSK